MATIRQINPTTYSSNPYVQSLISTQVWSAGDLITYHLKATDLDGNGRNDLVEKGAAAAIKASYDAFAAVANIRVQEVSNPRDAVWVEQAVATGNGGVHYLPFNRNRAGEDGGEYSILDVDPAEFAKGGQWYAIAIHEIGHGLGLEHTHESGRFPGVPAGAENAAGSNGLNSELFSIMSYRDVTSFTYGTPATPMAFDIAAVQALYGANMSTATGADGYVLPTRNVAGSFYECIWDAGGTDTISVGSNASDGATIDLRAATLRNEAGGGGFLSKVKGIDGGFTIANGVTIENANGGAQADVLIGNGAANRLDGKAGADRMMGGGGNDTYFVDNANDVVIEGANGGNDTVKTSVTYKLAADAQVETLSTTLSTGMARIDLTGNGFAQTIIGNDRGQIINGGGGNDILTGRGGGDAFVFSTKLGVNNVDTITDFEAAGNVDVIRLENAIFVGLPTGALASSAFVVSNKAKDGFDRIIYNSNTGDLFFDRDGSGSAFKAIQFASLDDHLAMTAGDFTVI